MTVKELIDVIDINRSYENEMIHIINNEHEELVAPTSSPVWKYYENRIIDGLEACGPNHYNVWLEDEKEAADDKDNI